MQDALVLPPPRSNAAVSATGVLWRATSAQRPGAAGKLRLTLVAKATFAWVHGGTMSPVAPDPIRAEDRNHGGLPARSVELAAEIAPLLRACDVLFTGSAIVASGQKAQSLAVRIGIFADRRPVLDKTLHVIGDRKVSAAPEPSPGDGAAGRASAPHAPTPFSRMPIVYERAFGGPGQDNPVGVETPNIVDPADPRRPAGFGPISRFWRPRKRLVEAMDRAPLERPVAEIPEDMPWAYYQAAPADQQIAYLRGGEWLVLDGLHAELPRVQTQLPFVQARGRVRAPNGALADVPMAADMLVLAGESMRASIVWRGQIELPFAEAELALLRSAVALESPGSPAVFDSLLAAESEARGPVSHAASGQRPPADAARAVPTGVIPDETVAAPAREAAGEATFTLAPESQAAASARSIAPFEVRAAGAGRVTPDVRATPWSAVPLSKPAEPLGEVTLPIGHRPEPSPRVVAPPPLLVSSAAAPPPPPPIASAPPEKQGPETQPSPEATTPEKVFQEAVIPKAWSNEGWTPPPRAPRARNPKATGLSPQALASRLQAAGMHEEDVRDFLLALEPPPPPPDDT